MKLFVAIILTAVLAFVSGLYLPWWSIVIAAFLTALLVHQRAGRAFLSGFVGIFILWAFLAWWIDMKNQGILSKKMAELFHLGTSSILIILVIGAVAGWLAGQIVRGMGFGLIGNIVVGIVGAFIAGWLLPRIGIVIGGGMLGSIINATIGAVVLLVIVGLIRRG